MANKNGSVVYVTPEIALDQSLHTYSGGLGVLAGGYARTAYELKYPTVIVTVLPRMGYYEQGVSGNEMSVSYVGRHYRGLLKDTGVRLNIPINRSPVYVAVRELPEGAFGNCRTLFLDSDIPENNRPEEGSIGRTNTLGLYGGTRGQGANIDRKISQSIILGRGGVLAPQALGIKADIYHIQESHAVFAGVELLNEERSGATAGTPKFEEALKRVRSRILFTTHTPVKEGNPEYSLLDVKRLSGYDEGMLKLVGCGGEYGNFHTAAAGRYLAGITNAVSRRHLDISQKLLHWVPTDMPFEYVTNGQHRGYWQHPDFRSVETADELERVKRIHVCKFAEQVRQWTGGRCWSEREEDGTAFTACWSSRFAHYKRPYLLRRDKVWLRQFLVEKKARLFVAGKPHPDDDRMINEWNEWYKLSKEEPRIAVVPGYELDMMRAVKAGTHLSIKTARAPYEACGSYGMGEAQNGGLNLAPPDGWMLEANPDNCFIYGSNGVADYDQDAFDAEELYGGLLNSHIMFMKNPGLWYDKNLAAKREAETQWDTDRMFKQYIELYERLRETRQKG